MSNLSNNEMQRGVNWKQVVKNVVEQYDDPIHGVQKDAVQNGKDAIPKHGKNNDGTPKEAYVKNNWKFSFELTEIFPKGKPPVKALIMTDYGTTGLIGERRVEDFKDEECPPIEEKWARFESYAMANEGGQTLGARGQGKFVFISASKQDLMIYDTRKINGQYRVGYTTVSAGKSPVFALDGNEGEKWIMEEWGIKPMPDNGIFGTRIIIVDPNEELIARLESGEFLEHIKETWWPFIRDFGARIEVIVNGNSSFATVPDIINKLNENKDSADTKFWNKDGMKFRFGQWAGKEYKIKEFRIVAFHNDSLPKAYRGISIFRGGMKVQTVQPFFGAEFESRITGYLILDSNVDEMLREVEKPSHYEFNEKGIWKKLKAVISDEVMKFAVEKLGIGISSSASPEEKRQASVSKAFQIFHFLSKDWPLNLGGHGPTTPPTPPTLHPPYIKNRYVAIKGFIFPNPANVARLDWGQTVSGWWLEAGNKKSKAVEVQLECFVFSASGKLFELVNKKMYLGPNSVSKYMENNAGLNLSINKSLFPGPGKYKLTAMITDLQTKKIIDEVSRFFWIEMDPPLQAPFSMEGVHFSDVLPSQVELEWKMQLGEEGNIVYYNLDHPSFTSSAKQNTDSIFLGEVAGMAGIQLLISDVGTISAEEARSKKLPFNYDSLFGKNDVERYLETVRLRAFIRHKILSNYLT